MRDRINHVVNRFKSRLRSSSRRARELSWREESGGGGGGLKRQ